MDGIMHHFFKYSFISLLLMFLVSGCAFNQPQLSQSATILLKTPTMKFYDKGFITKYDDHTHVQIFSAGAVVLSLDIYEDRICKSTFECLSLKDFNKQNLNASYKDTFIKELFEKADKNVIFKDKKAGILIKITRD